MGIRRRCKWLHTAPVSCRRSRFDSGRRSKASVIMPSASAVQCLRREVGHGTMNRLWQIAMMFVLFVLFAVFGATPASALEWESADFLVGGKVAEAGQAALAEGELLLEDAKLGIAVECGGYLDGEFQTASDLLFSKVLSLAGVEVEVLKGEGLLCKPEKGCASNADLEVWPENLPWLFAPQLDVIEHAPWIAMFGEGGPPGYTVKCLVLGISTEETCTIAEGSGNEVTNATGGVETATATIVEPDGDCTTGGVGAGVIEASTAGLITSTAGTVSISIP